ncbi:putative transcription factor bHLH041 [Silene latifolia]|uniref:putative transcription factor bHLH041 n=1 Tax=Silene latifolia TaxID=37657 RepID=UPI003D77DF4B
MDSVFRLSNGDRVSYLLNLMHSFGCSYICLWSYSPDINLMYCEEGHFQEGETIQVLASSSSGTTLARKLFEDYKQALFIVGDQSLVPGLAFKNRKPYLELQELDLQGLASIEVQRHFYLEAGIKMAVFLGCDRGEIELGMSYIPENMEMKMQNICSQDFTRLQSSHQLGMEMSRLIDQSISRPSSSSSPQSITNSPEYSQLFYTLPSITTPYLQEARPVIQESTTTTTMTKAQTITTMPELNQLLDIPFPTLETTNAALTRAYLAILSSSSTNSVQQSRVSNCGSQVRQRPSAFKSYHHHQGLGISQMRCDLRSQTSFKRIILYYKGINYRRIQEHSSVHGNRPTSTQLHHMISERRRREKINDSFQALRSLLPQGTKKDKASVLKATKEYMSSLKTQLSELSKRNQVLETQLKIKQEAATTIQEVESTNDELSVQIIPVSESTSRERLVDLRVRLRGYSSMPDLVMRLLEFIKQSNETSVVSMEAQTLQQRVVADHISTDLVTFRLRIEGNEWDETNFKEAAQRVLMDLGHPQN